MGKRILCLYRPQENKLLSAMIRGAHDGQNFIVTDYKEEDLEAIFQSFFNPEKKSDSSWKRECFHEEGEFRI